MSIQLEPNRLLKVAAIAAASALVATGATAFVLRQDRPEAAPPGQEPKVSIQEIMLTQIDAAADKVWGSAGSISDEHGVRDLAPTTDAEWEALGAAAVTLTEAPNLLVQEGRPLAPHGVKIQDQGLEGIATPQQIQQALVRDRPAFLQYARRLQATGEEIRAAVARRDAAALDPLGAQLDEACEACHQHFWYPPQPKR